MRTFKYIVCAAMLLVSLCLVGCRSDHGEDAPLDYGTLTIDNVTVNKGEQADLHTAFSKPEYAAQISFSFDSDAFGIRDGMVFGNKACVDVPVTATTAHHTATFTVTVTDTAVTDYGTLTVLDIDKFDDDNRARIYFTFSDPQYIEKIEYSFAGNAISIANGYVTALVGGQNVTVTAKTAHHETTFQVRTFGSLEIDDVTAWIGYPQSELDIRFAFPVCAESLSFSYDKTKLTIDADKKTVKALAAGTYTVTASSEHFRTSFQVKCVAVDKSISSYKLPDDYPQKLQEVATTYQTHTSTNRSTTLFIGDSYFDGYQWDDWNFYAETYYGKDALRCGIGGSSTYNWEYFIEQWLSKVSVKPQNIVMHIGTNNVYNDRDLNGVAECVDGLQRMFYMLHAAVPNAPIYWCNISQRDHDTAKIAIVREVNAIMETWCQNRAWITYVDTSSKLTTAMLKDGTHIKVEYYSIFVEELEKAGLTVADKAGQ